LCLDVGERPLLQNIRKGLIDPDTPEDAMYKKNADGKVWQLVVSSGLWDEATLSHATDMQQFSDEFNTPGRTFYDDDDPFFQAVDLWYGVTADKEVCIILCSPSTMAR
jgi:hypothetical protein